MSGPPPFREWVHQDQTDEDLRAVIAVISEYERVATFGHTLVYEGREALLSCADDLRHALDVTRPGYRARGGVINAEFADPRPTPASATHGDGSRLPSAGPPGKASAAAGGGGSATDRQETP